MNPFDVERREAAKARFPFTFRCVVATPRRHDSDEGLTELAVKARELCHARWGGRYAAPIIGLHPRMLEAQHRMLVCAQADSAVLIRGETGTGKELFARAMHALSRRRAAPYLCVNCAQYHDGQLVASELFGHRRGSFTGAVADHTGIFENADTGIVFLDEIAELSPVAQAMLLRTLSEGEVLPVGDTHARHVNVRVFAATGRDLKAEVARGSFREDLYYRLRYFQVNVPALRERGDDWELIANALLKKLAADSGVCRTLSSEARQMLREYHWPGNVRELRSVIETAYHGTEGSVIECAAFVDQLDGGAIAPPSHSAPATELVLPAPSSHFLARVPHAAISEAHILYRAIVVEKRSFWDVVYEPFMNRDINRRDARALIERGLFETRGSYKRLVTLFGLRSDDYLRFMDFLRHHRLKPSQDDAGAAAAAVALADASARSGETLAVQ